MSKLTGIIQEDGKIKVGKKLFVMCIRGTDRKGYPEVLIDATEKGGKGCFSRQSIKPYIGMAVEFYSNEKPYGFNYKILK